jgi:ribonuclease HI
MQHKKLVIFTDGGAEPNPGKAGIGIVIKDEQDRTISTVSRSIGFATNNQAEYRAIITALEKAVRMGAEEVALRSDSELVVRQINGRYRVKNAELKPLYQQVKELQGRFKSFKIAHVSREQNREADSLSNRTRG